MEVQAALEAQQMSIDYGNAAKGHCKQAEDNPEQDQKPSGRARTNDAISIVEVMRAVRAQLTAWALVPEFTVS